MTTDAYVKQFDEFLDATVDARRDAEQVRDYLNHKQWTSGEAKVLLDRGQAPVVKNIMRRKHDTLLGVERQRRTDPKALARTPKHDEDSDAVTKAIRYVADNTDLDQTSSEVFDEVLAEGYGGAIVEIEQTKRGIEIKINQTHWDRTYYDPHSRKKDFSDASFIGVTTWLAVSKAKQMFPNVKDDLADIGEMSSEEFSDRPRWIDKKTTDPRIRINEHYFLKDGIWHQVFFTKGLILSEEKPSPFLDDYDEPQCPIELVCSYVGSDNERYGLDKGMVNGQDEVNHRTSKALHMLSSVILTTTPGAVKSGKRTLDQLASGKAHIELLDPNGRADVDHNNELAQGQLVMLQEAKEYLDEFGPNEVIAGKDDSALSGRALLQKQQAGLTELAHIFDAHSHWKVRIFRQIWNRIRQFWTEERWIRVTDDEKNVKFVGLNRPVTVRDNLAKEAGVEVDQLDGFLQENGVSAPFDLDTPTGEIENQVSEMDVDIILTESPNIAILQDEQFDMFLQLASSPSYAGQIPLDALLKLSNLTNKDEALEMIGAGEGNKEAAQQQQQQLQQAQLQQAQETAQADLALKVSGARKNNAAADQTQVETQLAIAGREAIG